MSVGKEFEIPLKQTLLGELFLGVRLHMSIQKNHYIKNRFSQVQSHNTCGGPCEVNSWHSCTPVAVRELGSILFHHIIMLSRFNFFFPESKVSLKEHFP